MRKNTVKASLVAGEPVVGCFVTIPAPTAVEVAAAAGFDFIIIDAEHGSADLETVENMIRAAETFDCVPIVRIAVNQPQVILRYLDAGALGVQMPQIQNATEAKRVVDAVKYRPFGRRGLASIRAARYGIGVPLGRYVQEANEETLVVVHVETPEAVAEAEAIARVPGVDVVFVGPTDLSYSLGYPGEPMRSEVQSVIHKVFTAVLAAGKVPGIWAGSPESARNYVARGARYIAVTERSLIVPAFQAFVKGIKGA
ncbi:MAG: hypothetical protein HXY20_15255 [Acidobacteria bacterium]|nr:hypothetical protein [Acidobacteriota bacterium]